MTLEGAKFICLDEAGNHGETVLAKGRKFTMGYYVSCDFVLVDERAKGVHCEIECDAFGRVTIRNLSPDKPILVNGSAVEIKRSLLNNSKLSILDKEYLWLFSKSCSNEFEDIQREITSTPLKQIGIPEQPPNSCPDFKLHRDLPKRFTVHNFAYYIHSDDESNISNDDESTNEGTESNQTQNESKDSSENTSQNTEKEQPKRSITPEPNNELVKSKTELLETPKSDIINCSQDKENKSTQKKNKQLLTLCHQSDVVITSFSPRETGVKIEKSFAVVIKPKLLVTKPPATPKSVYSTPKGDIGEDDENERDLITFHTPSTSKKGGVQSNATAKTLRNSSMYLIDLTTPNKLGPTSPCPKSALKFSNKKNKTQINKSCIKSSSDEQLGVTTLPATPTVVSEASNSALVTPSSVITVNSSKDISSVIEVTSDGSNMAITSGGSAHVPKTPLKAQTYSGVNTPKRTPHSLMKRALLTSAKKQNSTSQTNAQKLNTPRKENINRTPVQSNSNLSPSQLPRNQSMSTPARESMSGKTHFDNTPTTSNLASSSKMSPRRSSINPISAAKALPTSTPMSCLKNKFTLKSNTSSLHKVRKSLGGIPLSSHISKARKSIAQSSTSLKITSIKEKSPQQVMSNRLVVRARNSLCVTPFSGGSRKMFAIEKIENQSTIIKDKTTHSAKKPDRKVVLFASHRPLDGSEADNLSRTFIIDSDEEENVDTKKRQDKPKDATFSPAKDSNEKKEKNKLNQTIEIPVDVEEVGLTKESKSNEAEDKEQNNVTELQEKVNYKDNSAAPLSDSDKMKAIVTEESFAEVINDYQEKSNLGDTIEIVDSPTKQESQESFIEDVDKCNEKTPAHATQNLIRTLKQDNNVAGNVETGFGEESSVEISQIPKGSSTEEYNPNNGENNKATDDTQEQRNTCNSPSGQQTVLIQKTTAEETKTSDEQKGDERESCEYKPIVEDITLEGSFIEKELAKDNEEIVLSKPQPQEENLLKSEEIKTENAEIVIKEFTDNEQLSTSSKVCAIKEPLEKLQLDDVKAEINIQQTKEISTDVKEKEMAMRDQTEEAEATDKSDRTDLVEPLAADKNETDIKEKLSETQTEPSKTSAVNEETLKEETANMSQKENSFQTAASADAQRATMPEDETAADLGDTNKLLEEIEDVLNKSDEMKQKHLDDLEECSDKPLTEEFESENTDEVEDVEESKLEEKTLNKDAQIIQLNKEDNNVNESSEGQLENKKTEEHIDNAETNSESKDQELKTSDTNVSLNQGEMDAINENSETANNENDIQNQTNVPKPEVVVTESIACEGEIENTKNVTKDIPKQSESKTEYEINSQEKNEEEIIQFVQKNQKIGDDDDREENIIIESESKCSSPAKETKDLKSSEVKNYTDMTNKVENTACFTPRRITRRNSQLTNTPELYAEPPMFTPKRSSRRASMSAESPITSTPTKTSRRRASLSCHETLLTPQRITRRRSSIFIDEETSKPSTSKLQRAKTPRKQFEQSLVIPEEVVDEVAGVIIIDDDEEPKHEQIHLEENKCQNSILRDDATGKTSAAVQTPKAKTTRRNLEKSMVILEEVDDNDDDVSILVEKEIENKDNQITSTEEILDLKIENKKHENVSTSDKKPELLEKEQEQENVITHNAGSEQQQRASAENIEIIVLEDDSDAEEIREDLTIVQGHTADNLNKTVAGTPSERHGSATQQSEISDQIVPQEATPKVEDHNIAIEVSSERSDEKASSKAPNGTELAESSTNVEQKEISSPAGESTNKILDDSPKSPRELLKTPKPEAAGLAHSPKEAILNEKKEKEEEKLTELAVAADLIETSQTNISENSTSACKQELKTADVSSKTSLLAAQTPGLDDGEREIVHTPKEGLENEGEEIENLAVEKTPATPKNRKRVTLLVESPKTPAMTFVRELLKTPKRKMPTPKENRENEQEIAASKNNQNIMEEMPSSSVKTPAPAPAPATPKDKKRVTIVIESPKTPAMTFVRDLLKTPKREVSTPREAGIHDFMRVPKENTENEQEEVEKLSMVAQLVETPQAYTNEQNLIEETPATPKDKKRVTFVVESPKTPAMTFVRELLKTPKREMPTPKENTENEQEEIEKNAMVKQLVETPQGSKNNQNIAEEMPSSSMKNINLKGVKELLKTPKTCTTPRFRGIRELMQTPKASSSPIISGVKELLESPNTQEASEISVSKQLSEEISSAATTSENVDNLKGVKELLKTPKCCSTPRFKGIKELMKTPITSSTPLLGGIKELMDTPAQQKDSHELEKFLRTPTAKNVMIPSMPSSAIIEKRSDSIEVSTEYDLNATNVDESINLEELFKAPVAAHFAERITESYYGEQEEEIDEQFTRTSNESLQDTLNKTAEDAFDKLVGQETQIQTPVRKRYERKRFTLQTPHTKSPFTGADILSDLPRSDVEEWIDTLEQAEPPTILPCDDSDEEQEAVELESAEKSALTYSVNEQDSNESIIPETCTKVYLTDNSYTTKASKSKDPLSNTHKKVKEKPTCSSLATSIDAEISGINLLDQTFESLPDEPSMLEEPLFVDEPSMFEEALVVSDNESEAENVLNYSNDLSEPLLVSDSEDLNHSQEAETNEMLRIENALEMMQVQNELLQTSNLTLNEQEKSMLEKAPNVVDSMAEDPLETANQNEISSQLIKEDKALIEIAISQSEDECEEKSLTKPEHSFPLEDCSINDLFTNENIESEFFETVEQQENSVILEDFSASKMTDDPTENESIIESINAEIDSAATDEHNDAKQIAIEHTKLISVESRDPPSVTEICEETNLFNEEPAERKGNVSSKECQDIFLDNSNTDEANEENKIAVSEVVEATENNPVDVSLSAETDIISAKGTPVISEAVVMEAELSDRKLEETIDELKNSVEKTMQIETQPEDTSAIDVDALGKNTFETLVIEDKSVSEDQTEDQSSKTTAIQQEPSDNSNELYDDVKEEESTTTNEEVLPPSSKVSEEIKSDFAQDLSVEDKTFVEPTQSQIGEIITIPECELQETEVDLTSETEKTVSSTDSMSSEAVPKLMAHKNNEILVDIPRTSNSNCSQKSKGNNSSDSDVIFKSDELNPTQSISDEIIPIPECELEETEDLTYETENIVGLTDPSIKYSSKESMSSSEAVTKTMEYKNEAETNEILENPVSSDQTLDPTRSLIDEVVTVSECESQDTEDLTSETEKTAGLSDESIKDAPKISISSEAVPKPKEYKNENETNKVLEIPGSSNENYSQKSDDNNSSDNKPLELCLSLSLIDEVITASEEELLASETEKPAGLTDESIKNSSQESMSSETVPKPMEYKNNEILEIPGSPNANWSQKSACTNSSDDKVIIQSEVFEDIISISSDTQESSNTPEENLQPVHKPQTDESETEVAEKVVEIYMEKSVLPKSSNEEILDNSARELTPSTTIIKYDFEVKINDSSHAKETETEVDNSETKKSLTEEARKSQASGATSTEITSQVEEDLEAGATFLHQEERTGDAQNNPTQVSEELVKVLDESTEMKETKSNKTALVLTKRTVSESRQESAKKEEISTSSTRDSRKINQKTTKQKLEKVEQEMKDNMQISEKTIPDVVKESEKPKKKRTTSESSQGSVKDDDNCIRTRRGGRRKIQKAVVAETVPEQREECEEHTMPQLAEEARTDTGILPEENSTTDQPLMGKQNIPKETDTQSNQKTTTQTAQITVNIESTGKDNEALHESGTKPSEEHVIEQDDQLGNEIQNEEIKEIDEIQKQIDSAEMQRTKVETAEHASSTDSNETTENQIAKQVATAETSTSPITLNEECLTKALTPESEVETIDAASENQFIAIVSQETSLAALIEEENSDVSKEIFAEMSKTPDEEQMDEKADEVTLPAASVSSCLLNLEAGEEQILEIPSNVIEISEEDEDATSVKENLAIVEEVAKHQTVRRGRRKPTISESSQDSDHKVSSSSKMSRRKIQKTPIEEVVIEEIEEDKAVTSVKTDKMNVEVEEISNETKLCPAIEELDSKSVEITEAHSSTLKVQQQEPKRTRRKPSVSESSQGSVHEDDTIRTRRGRRKALITPVEDVLIEEEQNEENIVQMAANEQKTEKEAEDTSSKLNEIENKIKSDADNIDNPPQEVESKESVIPDPKSEHEEHQAQFTECEILQKAEDDDKNEESKPTPSKRGRKKKMLVDPGTGRRRGRPKLQVTKAEAAAAKAKAKSETETENLEDAKAKENEIESKATEEQAIPKIDEVSNEKMLENDEQKSKELPAPGQTQQETNEAKQIVKRARLRKLEGENEIEKDKAETNSSHTTRRGRRHNNAETSETSVAATLQNRSTNRNRKTPVEQSSDTHQEEQLVKEVCADSEISKTTPEEPQKETVEIQQPPESAENILTVTEGTDDSKSIKKTKLSADEDKKQELATCAESSTSTSEVVVLVVGDEKSTKKRTRAQKTKIEESHKEETEIENIPSHDEEVEQQRSTKRRAAVKHVQQPELSAKSKRRREAAEAHSENVMDIKKATEVAALSEEKTSEVNLPPEPSLDHQNTSPQAPSREVKTRKARRNAIIEVTHPEDHETLSPSKRKAVVKHIKQDHNESGDPSNKRRVDRKNQTEEKHEAEVDKVAQTETIKIASQHHSIVEGVQEKLSVMNREEEENKTNVGSSTNKKEESQLTEIGETSSRRRNAGKKKPDYKEADDDDTQVLKKTINVEAATNVENTIDPNEGKVKQDPVEQQPQVSTKKGRGRKKKNDHTEEDEQSAILNSPETKDNKSRKRKQSHTDIYEHTSKEAVDKTDEKITKQTEANTNIPSDITEHQTPKSSAPASKKVRKAFEHITAESEEVEDTPGRRGRNVPQRRAATAYHNYDETSDTEISTKAKKKTDSPRKSLEAVKKSPTTTATLAPIVSVSPSLSSAGLITTARGRTRKPTAKVQQFLEEERAKAETPKRRALLAAAAAAATAATTTTTTTTITIDCATPQRTPARRGRKPSTIETEVEGTPHTSKSRGKAKPSAILLTNEEGDTTVAPEITTVVEEKEIELQTTPPPANSVKIRRGRKPKITEEQSHSSEEPPAKKTPVELESEKQDSTPAVPVSTPPTRVAGKRNAAAAAKARIEEDALAAAAAIAIEPPKRSRAKKATPKVSTPAVATADAEADEKDGGNKTQTQTPSQKREHRLTSASTVEGVEDLQDDTEMEIKDKPANKRARKPAAASKTAEEGEVEETLPAKRGRKPKIINDMDDDETPQQSSKTTRVRGRGRKNVQIDGHQEAEATPSNQQNPTDIKPVPAETSSEPLKKSIRTRRK